MSSKNSGCNQRKKGKKSTERSNRTQRDNDKTDVNNIDKRNIVRFVQRTLEKGPQGLRAEFQTMKRTNNWELMKAFKEANECGRNRYKDVGCLDASRVKLGAPWDHEYIHGNYVSTPDSPKRFICTQAPLEKTCADFWFMCLQEHVEVIYMLCNLTEKGAKKCYEYYPNKDNDTLTFKEGAQEIVVKYKTSKLFKFSGNDIKAKVRETIVMVEGAGGKSLKTKHYHWVDWPDRGVPPADMAIIQLLDKTRGTKSPIVVHCSAGIGRTGSVVMIEYVLEQLAMNQPIEDTDKILLKIREQRNNSVQTDHQYLFVHQVLMNYFKSRSALDAIVEQAHDAFTKDYFKMVI